MPFGLLGECEDSHFEMIRYGVPVFLEKFVICTTVFIHLACSQEFARLCFKHLILPKYLIPLICVFFVPVYFVCFEHVTVI